MVRDVEAAVADLRAKGVSFEEYDLPGLKTVNRIAELGGMRGASTSRPSPRPCASSASNPRSRRRSRQPGPCSGAPSHRATEYPVHVHVVPADSPEVAALRGLRDALRADPVLRRRYAVLKRAIVAGGPADPVAFTRAKHHWIAATLTHLGLADEPPRRLYQDDLHPDNPDRLAS